MKGMGISTSIKKSAMKVMNSITIDMLKAIKKEACSICEN